MGHPPDRRLRHRPSELASRLTCPHVYPPHQQTQEWNPAPTRAERAPAVPAGHARHLTQPGVRFRELPPLR